MIWLLVKEIVLVIISGVSAEALTKRLIRNQKTKNRKKVRDVLRGPKTVGKTIVARQLELKLIIPKNGDPKIAGRQRAIVVKFAPKHEQITIDVETIDPKFDPKHALIDPKHALIEPKHAQIAPQIVLIASKS